MIHIQTVNQINNKYLCYTNLLLILSILYFFYNKDEKTPYMEYLLVSFLIPIIITSQIFWNNPIKGSKIHKIDALISKTAIISFIVYVLIYKFSFIRLFILLGIIVSFYFSNYYSNKEWCCNKHIFYHGLLHIFCFISTFYTFSPILK
jgi:phosphatidylserine synthase